VSKKKIPFPLDLLPFFPLRGEQAYLPVPNPFVFEMLERGEFLKTERGIVPKTRPKFELKSFTEGKLEPEECFRWLAERSKGHYYQAKDFFSFTDFPLGKHLSDFPVSTSFKYLFVGGGNCLPEFLRINFFDDPENLFVLDVDDEVLEYYRGKGYKHVWRADTRFLKNAILPHSPFHVIVSYHVEYFQTVPLVSLAHNNLVNFGYLYLLFASAELEDRFDFEIVLQTLWKHRFWIVEFNPFFIKAVKLDGFRFWKEFLKEI